MSRRFYGASNRTRRAAPLALTTALFLALVAPAPALAQTSGPEPCPAAQSDQEALGTIEQRIVEHIDASREEAVALLERTVEINSGTMNHEGVRRVGRIFREELDALGFETRWIDMSDVDRAGHLFAEIGSGGPDAAGPHLLLIGHLDTVFEEDSPFQRFRIEEDSVASGPGVQDMKGGNVVLLHALKALHAAGALDGVRITVALIGDEEDPGKPIAVSREHLLEAGRQADIALGFEGASGEGDLAVVARRGSSGWTLRVTGTEGHSSRIFSEELGSGAIFEAARILHAFHEELRGEEHLTFNPGVILGGTDVRYDPEEHRGTAFGKTNVIAANALVDGGLRFITEEQKERARAAMRAVVAESLPRTSAEVEFRDSYPAMPPTEGNMVLLETLDAVSRQLGHGPVGAVDPGARGAADISFVAPLVDGLDGLGPVGSGAHTLQERVDLRSLSVATRRAAILIHRLSRPERDRTEGDSRAAEGNR